MNEDSDLKIQANSGAASTTQLDPPSAGNQNNSPELQVSFSSNSTGIRSLHIPFRVCRRMCNQENALNEPLFERITSLFKIYGVNISGYVGSFQGLIGIPGSL